MEYDLFSLVSQQFFGWLIACDRKDVSHFLT